MPTLTLRMLRTASGSRGPLRPVETFPAGTTAIFRADDPHDADLARVFLREGWAVEDREVRAEEVKAEEPAPEAPVEVPAEAPAPAPPSSLRSRRRRR